MKKLLIFCAVVAGLAIGSSVVQANEVTLVFNANDIFNYATSDDTRLNQQGIARRIWDSPTGRYYLTYNDSTRDSGATATDDLESVANILGWDGCWAGYQEASHLQLWLRGSIGNTWGEQVVRNVDFTAASVYDEFGWTADVSTGWVHYNTVLGGNPSVDQNAISPCFHPAECLWSVTGDFFIDNNGNGTYDSAVDSDLVVGQQYTIWFNAALNNWHLVDTYGNDAWGSPDAEGTIIATAFPAAISDEIGGIVECCSNARNHGKFVSCVAQLTNDWMMDELITGEEKGAIQSWAAQADIP